MQWLAVLALTSLAVFFETLARHVALAGGDAKLLRVRGVPVSKSSLYSPGKDFECLDGSLLLPFERVNDDYCDCADGSDEPGTAACTNASFYCQNSGYQATYIPSSRVNDGVCDCCDASDEYSSNVQCIDNCHELGREAWLEAQRVVELAKDGNKIRLEYIQKGKQLRTENQAKLAEYRTSYEEAELTKKEKEVVKTRAEEREAAALEKYKPPAAAAAAAAAEVDQQEEKDMSEDDAKEYFLMLDSDSSGTVTIAELQTRVTFDKDRNGEVSREEALHFLNNQEELTMQEFVDSAWANVKPFLMLEKGIFKPAEKKEEDSLEEEHGQPDDGDDEPLDDDDHEEHEEEEHEHEEDEQGHEGKVEDANNQQSEKQPDSEKEPAIQYDDETQALIDEAREARDKFQEAERRVQELQSEIRKLEERVERDYGPEDVFASLDGQCFDYTDLEYVYTLCLYGRATQRSKSGGSEVNLGQWDDWIGDAAAAAAAAAAANKYTKAKFDRGLTCWNGPSRNTIVSLKCGIENKLTAVAEPNRCEYTMDFETPALCNPNVEQNTDLHDEL